jgi:hypothetical protein
MDSVMQVIFSWQLLLLALGITAIIQILTIILTYFEVQWLQSKFWNLLVLPLLPLLLGGLSGLLDIPMPFTNISKSASVMFGLVSGLLSTYIYHRIKDIFNIPNIHPDPPFISQGGTTVLVSTPAAPPPVVVVSPDVVITASSNPRAQI